MARIDNKDKEFWEFVGKFDYVGLCEMWITKERWEQIKGRLPNTHLWLGIPARKEKKKGRTSGGNDDR